MHLNRGNAGKRSFVDIEKATCYNVAGFKTSGGQLAGRGYSDGEVFMFSYIWPIALVIFCNTLYQVCAKATPQGIDPFASLTVTYGVGAIASAIAYFALNKNGNLFKEYAQLNWAPFVFGIVLLGLEVGFIYAYRAGWQVSMATIVQSSIVAVALIFIGYLFYHEAITWNKVAGIIICLAGLVLINK